MTPAPQPEPIDYLECARMDIRGNSYILGDSMVVDMEEVDAIINKLKDERLRSRPAPAPERQITLAKYETYIKIIILKSPEELELNLSYFRKFTPLIKLHHDPETRMLSIKIDNTISDEIFGFVIRSLLSSEEKFTGLTGRSYYNSMVRRRFP